jgi:hypothetical protein
MRSIALAVFCLALASWPAHAQTTAPARRAPANVQTPTDCLPLDPRPACKNGVFAGGATDISASAGGSQLEQLQQKLAALSLDDFKYALALSISTKNTVTQPCWQAWVDLISQQQAPLKDAAGNALTEPTPHIFTDVEKLAELVNELQPNSPISTGCAPMAMAAQKDIGNLIGAVVSGGALGLVKLPFAIP